MKEEITAGAERIAAVFAKHTDGAEPALARVAERIAKIFRVEPDEVAILARVDQGHNLRFLVPEGLKEVGTIPVTSPSALAARTARERRGEIINNFSKARHASVFEGVPLGRQSEPIQKIMSAPISIDGRLVGVLQVSRKGTGHKHAGPDFTQSDLIELGEIADALGKLIEPVPVR